MIDRRQDRAQFRGSEQHFEERGMIGAEPADTMSALDAEIAEPVRQTTYPVREFSVRMTRVAVDQRGLIGTIRARRSIHRAIPDPASRNCLASRPHHSSFG